METKIDFFNSCGFNSSVSEINFDTYCFISPQLYRIKTIQF